MGNIETTVALDKYKGFRMVWYKILVYAVLPVIALACFLGVLAHILTIVNCAVLGGGLEGILDLMSKVKLTDPQIYTNYLDGNTFLGSYLVADILAIVLFAAAGVGLVTSIINFIKLKKGVALLMSASLILIPFTMFVYETSVVVTAHGDVAFGFWSMGCLISLIPLVGLSNVYFKKRDTLFIN